MPRSPKVVRASNPALAPKRVWNNSASVVRIRGRKGQEIRKAHLDNEPLCRECAKAGKVKIATIVDHIIPLAEGGTEDPSNKQSLCDDCHDAKSKREAANGKRGKAHPEWLPKSAIPVTLVCGPAGGGKSTYVREHAKPGDIIIDLDEINQELTGRHGHQRIKADIGPALWTRNRRLAQLAEMRTGQAWFIVGAPTERERQWWKDALGAIDIVLLDPGMDVIRQRIGNNLRRVTVAEQWYRRRFETWFPPCSPSVPRGGV